jgi:DNA/RNA-binding domain of Phe-tRNA-synthetase-like protein
MFNITSTWHSTFPNAHAGILVMRNASNPAHHAELEKQKAELEESLRSQFTGQDRAAIASHPVLKVYGEYYKRFKKTYHVQLQLESIVLKGKSIPTVASLVECMFMA